MASAQVLETSFSGLLSSRWSFSIKVCYSWVQTIFLLIAMLQGKLESFSCNDLDSNENVAWKYTFGKYDYRFFLASLIVDRARCKWTDRRAVEVIWWGVKDLLLRVYVVVKTCKFHVVVWQIMSKNCTKVRSARAARLFFLVHPIRSLFSGVVVAVVLA